MFQAIQTFKCSGYETSIMFAVKIERWKIDHQILNVRDTKEVELLDWYMMD